MAEFKRRTLVLNTGKQLKLYGTSMAIGKTLEIGEGSAPNIFSCMEIEKEPGKPISSVLNPFKLSADELQEIADYNIRLWLDFKENLRKMGTDDPKIFNTDAVRGCITHLLAKTTRLLVKMHVYQIVTNVNTNVFTPCIYLCS